MKKQAKQHYGNRKSNMQQTSHIQKAIFSNAIDAISLATEDYQMASKSPRRILSCLRNIFAGLLLLMKAKLYPDHKELIITKRNNDGSVRNTIQYKNLLNEYTAINPTIIRKTLDQVQRQRNDLEHFYINDSPPIIDESVCACFYVICNILSNDFKQSPQEALGSKNWNILMNIQSVYEESRKECQASLSSVSWPSESILDALGYMPCPSCRATLRKIKTVAEKPIDRILECYSCKQQINLWDLIHNFEQDVIISATWDGETATCPSYEEMDLFALCPRCENKTFWKAELSCLSCGFIPEMVQCDLCKKETLRTDIETHDGGHFCIACFAGIGYE